MKYVGSSVDTNKRWSVHRKQLNSEKHHNLHLQRAWLKHSEDSFEFSVLSTFDNIEDARVFEQDFLDTCDWDTVYNISSSASGGDMISNHPERDRLCMEAGKRLTDWTKSLTPEERVKFFSTYPNPMQGRNHTEETRKKMSKAKKGRPNGLAGIPKSAEHRKKISENAKKRVGDKNPFYGKKHSEETKEKIREINKGRIPPNTRKFYAEGVVYPSMSSAARAYGVTPSLFTYRSRSDKYPEFYYLET